MQQMLVILLWAMELTSSSEISLVAVFWVMSNGSGSVGNEVTECVARCILTFAM